MITIFKTGEQGLDRIDEIAKGCWINVIDPTAAEIEWMRDLGVPQEFITYPLDLDERPRVEREDGETMILLRVPLYQGQASDVPYTTIPLGIIMDATWIMTLCRYDNDVLQELAAGKARGMSTAKRNRFILYLLQVTAAKYLTYLRDINRAVDVLEDQLQASMQNRELLGLLKCQKSLVYFTTALKANELMLERLQRTGFFRTYPDDEDLLEDVITENQQAIEMTNIANNILTSTMDAFASIINNNMNIVMKFLAVATVVLALPQLIASLFGMNVPVPFGANTFGFLFVTVGALFLGVLTALLFLRRRWI
jgi:magnesium transporter